MTNLNISDIIKQIETDAINSSTSDLQIKQILEFFASSTKSLSPDESPKNYNQCATNFIQTIFGQENLTAQTYYLDYYQSLIEK